MSNHIPFTDNYEDLSTDLGFQFRFNCERCGNGHMSSFERNATGLAGEALRVAGGFLGGMLGRAAHSSYDVQRMIGGPLHDAALRRAVQEISPLFTQCKRCGEWTCKEVCLNDQTNLCVNCTPKAEHEISAIENEATFQHVRERAQEANLGSGVKLQSAATRECPSCSADVAIGQRFCGECGTDTQAKPQCPSCGAEGEHKQKFCGECGKPMKA